MCHGIISNPVVPVTVLQRSHGLFGTRAEAFPEEAENAQSQQPPTHLRPLKFAENPSDSSLAPTSDFAHSAVPRSNINNNAFAEWVAHHGSRGDTDRKKCDRFTLIVSAFHLKEREVLQSYITTVRSLNQVCVNKKSKLTLDKIEVWSDLIAFIASPGNRRSWNYTVRTDKTQVRFFLNCFLIRSLCMAGESWSVCLQFPYEPDYGDRRSLNSSSAADQLVHEVKQRQTAEACFTFLTCIYCFVFKHKPFFSNLVRIDTMDPKMINYSSKTRDLIPV